MKVNATITALLALPRAESRVTKEKPCPVCAKPDWCLYDASLGIALCQRIESDRRVGEAGWVHVIDDELVEALPATTQVSKRITELQRGGAPLLHAVYTELLALLTLSPDHHLNLIQRGLTDEVILACGYKSLPQDGRRVLSQKMLDLVKAGELPRLRTVPGFYVESDGGEPYPGIRGNAGMLIPVRDTFGFIVGMQIRADNPAAAKYTWLSSAGQKYGCGPGAPAHVAIPTDLKAPNFVFVTEGPLKADIAAYCLGCVVLGLPGVSTYRKAIDILAKLLPRHVVMSYDNDKRENPQVRYYSNQLEKELVKCRFNVYEACWSSAYKGIDDYLASGTGQIQLRKVAVISKDGRYEYLADSLKGTAIQGKTYQKSPYKDCLAKTNKTDWVKLDSLSDGCTHIKSPLHLPPFALPGCTCAYCTAVVAYQADLVVKAVHLIASSPRADFQLKAKEKSPLKAVVTQDELAVAVDGAVIEAGLGQLKEFHALGETAPHRIAPADRLPFFKPGCRCRYCVEAKQWRGDPGNGDVIKAFLNIQTASHEEEWKEFEGEFIKTASRGELKSGNRPGKYYPVR
ncbi:hypothetical protein ES703_34341 [subsurface metagenome]